MSAPQDKVSGKLWDGALDAQHAFGDLDGHRPALLGVHDAFDDSTAYRAELSARVDQPVLSETPRADSPSRPVRGTLESVTSAPNVVHRPSDSGGRRVTVHRSGWDEILGTAHRDHDLVVFLEGAGVAEPDAILDDPQWVDGTSTVSWTGAWLR
ncbi:hypothetical protein [Streptomyces chryseus]